MLAAYQDEHAPPYLYSLVLTALDTGMKNGEMLSLHWRSVDHVRGLVEVEPSKSGHRRVVPLRPEVVRALAE